MRKLIITTAIGLMVGIASPIMAAPQSSNNSGSYYVVQAGDTLSKISHDYQIPIQTIAEINQLNNPDSIFVGQKLRVEASKANSNLIPSAPVNKEKIQNGRYVVKSGDTLTSISKTTKVPMEKIISANRLTNPNTIFTGQVLIIPYSRNLTATASRHDTGIRENRISNKNDLALNIIEYAKGFLDCPYSYGAAGPDAFDCSGFVMFVYNHFGIQLPRTSAAQGTKGTKVEKSELIPGDLVFFNTSGKGISHVGIYIGDNKFIQSSSGRGRVIISNLSESYYIQRFVTAQRVL